ncbi:MAG: MotA/TolQ/ExbB proton channel family protein [Candidatus Omnitrophica bacterium]|nr:MotA/TolQ/ExbB proton channel family protein [Candidatus Omnitrophota bacterium]
MKQVFIKGILTALSVAVAVLIYLKVESIRMGGPVMVPLLLSSIFAFAIIIEKFVQFNKEGLNTQTLLKNIFESIERQRLKEAIDICDQANVGVARILKEGIMKYDRPKEEIKESMQDSFLYEMPLLEDKLPILVTLVQIAPLLGFLGTLVGLANIFSVIQARAARALPVSGIDFAQGIWQALICSMAGFLVAIPLLAASNYLANRVKLIAEQMERASTELLNFLIERRMP